MSQANATSIHSVEKILDYLSANYYETKQYSAQTSSHWRKFGELQTLVKTPNGYQLSGG
jgi:hypothetical protein